MSCVSNIENKDFNFFFKLFSGSPIFFDKAVFISPITAEILSEISVNFCDMAVAILLIILGIAFISFNPPKAKVFIIKFTGFDIIYGNLFAIAPVKSMVLWIMFIILVLKSASLCAKLT